jgi:hypothetical protein
VCVILLPVALVVIDATGCAPFGPSKWAAITVVSMVAIAGADGDRFAITAGASRYVTGGPTLAHLRSAGGPKAP